MKRTLKKIYLAAALRLVHAAICELPKLDKKAGEECLSLPAGISYAISTGYKAPTLFVQWDGSKLRRLREEPQQRCCKLFIKTLADAFILLTGRMSLAHLYARHGLIVAGEIADVMHLARLVNLAECYLFPPFITRRILPELPRLQASPLRLYARIFLGFLTNRY